jgi:hypothetical protein
MRAPGRNQNAGAEASREDAAHLRTFPLAGDGERSTAFWRRGREHAFDGGHTERQLKVKPPHSRE